MPKNAYYPLIPGGVYDGPEPDNYTGDPGDYGEGCRPDDDPPDTLVWQTLDGRRIPFVQLHERHLLNILRSCRCRVTKVTQTTIDALEAEVARRKLEPLPDYESLEEGKCVSAVSALYTWWKRVPAERVKILTEDFGMYLQCDEHGPAVFEHKLEDRTLAEKHCLGALLGYDDYLLRCPSEAAAARCEAVFQRWAVHVGIADKLGLA